MVVKRDKKLLSGISQKMELDLYFIGHGSKVCPRTLADGEIGSLEHEGAIHNSSASLWAERERRYDVL